MKDFILTIIIGFVCISLVSGLLFYSKKAFVVFGACILLTMIIAFSWLVGIVVKDLFLSLRRR